MIGSTAWDAWTHLSARFPAPTRTPWLRSEAGRVGLDQEIVTNARAGALLTLVDQTETRSGYTIADVLGADSAQIAAPGPTGLVAVTGASLPALVHTHPACSVQVAADLQDLLGLVEERAIAGGATAMHVGYVPASELWREVSTALEVGGYTAVTQPPEAVIDISNDGIDGLLGRVSRAQRKNIRREIKRFEDSDLRVILVPSESLVDSAVGQLLADHYSSFGHPATLETALDRIQRFARHPDAVGMALLDEDRTIGFSIFVADRQRGELFPRLSACRRGTHFEFFNLVYYQRVAWAARVGLSTAHYGTEGYNAKAHRGCRLEPRTSYVKVLRPSEAGAPQLRDLALAASVRNQQATRQALPASHLHLLDPPEPTDPGRGGSDA